MKTGEIKNKFLLGGSALFIVFAITEITGLWVTNWGISEFTASFYLAIALIVFNMRNILNSDSEATWVYWDDKPVRAINFHISGEDAEFLWIEATLDNKDKDKVSTMYMKGTV